MINVLYLICASPVVSRERYSLNSKTSGAVKSQGTDSHTHSHLDWHTRLVFNYEEGNIQKNETGNAID